MKTYEALIILKPILDVDNSDNVLKAFEDAVEKDGGKVVKKEKQGRKRLAYELNKFKDGFITTYVLSLDPSKLVALNRTCQLNEDILRTVLVNRENVNINDATIYGRDRSGEGPGRFGDRPDHRGGDRPDFRGGDRDRGFDRDRPRPGARSAE